MAVLTIDHEACRPQNGCCCCYSKPMSNFIHKALVTRSNMHLHILPHRWSWQGTHLWSVRCQLRDLGELWIPDPENPKSPVPLFLPPEIQASPHLSCGCEAGGIRMDAGGKEGQESTGVYGAYWASLHSDVGGRLSGTILGWSLYL